MDNRYDEFLRHFSRHHERLFAYVYSLLPNAADAEDVLQRTSLILWQKFDQFDPREEFFPWACGVAFYEVRNFLRVSSRRRLQFNTGLLAQLAEERAATLTQDDPRLSALAQCLKKLGDEDRRLVDGTYRDHKSVKELAQECGRAVQTLYNRLGAIRRGLLECIERTLQSERGAP